MKNYVFTAVTLLCCGVSNAQNWTLVESGTEIQLNTIDFGTEMVGYIGGNDSLLLKTDNGGETWSPVSYSGVSFYQDNEHILKLDFISETLGFMTTGPYGGTYKTTDGGLTWQSLFESTNFCFNSGLFMTDENNGFVGGSGCFQGELIERQTAGTWNQLDISASSGAAENYINDFSFFGQMGLAASNGGSIFTTIDGGSTWVKRSTPLGADARITSVAIISATLAYAGYEITGATTANGLLISTNGGLTWSDDLNSATFPDPVYYDLFEANSGSFYAMGDADADPTGTLLFTNDFSMWFSLAVSHPLRAMQASNATRLFAVGDSGYIITNEPFTGLAEHQNNSPKIGLFPNPASEQITLSGLPQNTQTIEITDPSGRLTAQFTLQNNSINISSLSPGIYTLTSQNGSDIRHASFVKY